MKDLEEKRGFSITRSIGKGFKSGILKLGEIINGKQEGSTANLSRHHVIEETPSGLISVMGGKWTSFRKMGEETVNAIIKQQGKNIEVVHKDSVTMKFKLMGGYSRV